MTFKVQTFILCMFQDQQVHCPNKTGYEMVYHIRVLIVTSRALQLLPSPTDCESEAFTRRLDTLA